MFRTTENSSADLPCSMQSQGLLQVIPLLKCPSYIDYFFRMDSISWCLSTGKTWVFGVIYKEKNPSRGMSTSYRLVKLAALHLDQQQDNIFRALTLWVSWILFES